MSRAKGFKVTEETKQKIRASKLGKKRTAFSAEWRKNIGNAVRGRVVTRETREKLRLASTGKKHTEKTKDKLRLRRGENHHWWGKKHSETTKEKMRKSNKRLMLGKKLSRATKKKISLALRGQKRTEETCKNISKSLLGKKHPNWQGGIYTGNKKIRKSREYKQWRKAVFERDDYTCQWTGCGKRGCYIEADHIKSFSRYPKLRFKVSNGRTLCKPHHRKTKTYGRG